MDSNLNCNEFFGFQLFEDLDDVIKAEIVIDNADFAQIDEVLYQHHPEGSPKPDKDNPLVQGLVKKLIARFNEDRAMKISDRRIWYKRVTGIVIFGAKIQITLKKFLYRRNASI